MSVLIGLPTTGLVKSMTAYDLFSLGQHTKAVLEVINSCNVPKNRNFLAKLAVSGNYSHLLSIDSDMRFPPDTLERLLARDKDIIGVPYYKRQLPLEPTYLPVSQESDDLYECVHMGTGMLLIKTEVFKKLPQPWFDYVDMGSDRHFCRLARQHGYKVWADPTIKINHIGDYEY